MALSTIRNVQKDGVSALPSVPSLFATWPPIRDELETETSELQDETVQECLPFLHASLDPSVDREEHGLPRLARDKHIRFLHQSLEKLPADYVGFDAARPWIIYWALTALSLLGQDVEPYRERYILQPAAPCVAKFQAIRAEVVTG